MKWVSIILLLSACAGQKVFYVSNDAWKEDYDTFVEVSQAINTHLQCNLIVVHFSGMVLTPSDYGKGYGFVSFTNNAETLEYLENSSKYLKKNIVGQTLITGAINYARYFETDILLTTVVNDPRYVISSYPYEQRLAYFVDLHELGHALGLPHSLESADIMAESVPSQWWLGVSDFQWIRFTNALKERGFKCP